MRIRRLRLPRCGSTEDEHLNWRNCRFDDADLRGIGGAIWRIDRYLAKMDEDLVRKLDKVGAER